MCKDSSLRQYRSQTCAASCAINLIIRNHWHSGGHCAVRQLCWTIRSNHSSAGDCTDDCTDDCAGDCAGDCAVRHLFGSIWSNHGSAGDCVNRHLFGTIRNHRGSAGHCVVCQSVVIPRVVMAVAYPGCRTRFEQAKKGLNAGYCEHYK